MAEVRYTVRLAAVGKHLAHVELAFEAGPEAVDVTLPAWTPGSYLIRDYARYVRDVTATRELAKIDKQTWRLAPGEAGEVVVSYAVYGHDLTVRTNHIDDTHAFLHGPATFLYPVALREAEIEVRVEAPAGWTVTTAMPRVEDRYRVRGVDELFDHPLHVGPVRSYVLPASVPVELAIWGDKAPGGPFSEDRLCADLAAIVDDHVARVGAVPFARYVFIVMLSHDAYGGLEHRASSANLYHPHFGASKKAYEGLLELLSHEFFHVWVGKRIAPAALLAFDYAREAYTPTLWLMEGITSHYDRYALLTAKRISARGFLDRVLDDWARLQATPGRMRTSLEQSSFDAWIKLYRPDESNLNTTVSYYLKGGLAMVALDLRIRRETAGARSLDDVVRLLWREFGATGTPHPEDLQAVFERACGRALGDMFRTQVRGVDDPELPYELAHVGLELRASADPATCQDGASPQWLGVTTAGIRVTGVFDGGPAQAAGVSPGDELVAIDGFRVTSDGDLRGLVGARRAGDRVTVTMFRRHRLVTREVVLATAPPTRFEITTSADPGPAAERFVAWLGEPYPAAPQVLATVTATARWV